MEREDLLAGKKILVVDDEPDVLETLRGLLDTADVVTAESFGAAKAHLERSYFDLAVLDIMGVNGYELLAICIRKNITAVMLTAHALTPEDIVKSFKMGAASFIPKDRIVEIPLFLNDILEAKQKGKDIRSKWAVRLGEAYWEKKFGLKWKEKEEHFWKNLSEI